MPAIGTPENTLSKALCTSLVLMVQHVPRFLKIFSYFLSDATFYFSSFLFCISPFSTHPFFSPITFCFVLIQANSTNRGLNLSTHNLVKVNV